MQNWNVTAPLQVHCIRIYYLDHPIKIDLMGWLKPQFHSCTSKLGKALKPLKEMAVMAGERLLKIQGTKSVPILNHG
jgi:hypothetical protein